MTALVNAPHLRTRTQVEVHVEPGAAPALDGLAEAADPVHEFLRAAWFGGMEMGSSLETIVARTSGGRLLAAIPAARRSWLKEVAGSYWPYRSFPLCAGVADAELAAILRAPGVRSALGRVWRLGPVYSDDPTATRLLDSARSSGWTVLSRTLGSCYVLDLKRLRAEGPWPSTKTQRKNRWLERRLADLGTLEFRRFSGADWTAQVMDALAGIESQSWVGRKGGDTKFLDPAMRKVWETGLRDPELARRLVASILYVAGEPAAFTFTLRAGSTLHCIANSFSENFREQSPGRLLLYREFAKAADEGAEKVDWGAGDAGYKTEMGAKPGPDILDHLFVRGSLVAALARPFWSRTRG